MTHPNPQDETTPANGSGDAGAPAKQHGDPLLAASQGATDGTEGSRQGPDPADRE